MPTKILQNLGDGLVMRCATSKDAEALSDFNARIHSDHGPDQPDEGVRAWVRDLLEAPHPSFKPEDFTIVEDTHSGKIVSSLNLISQTWSYGGVEFGVGRPELVATAPEYRHRGLVRAQFEVIHQWSADRGEKVQGITGIPYYYRLFGYEMAMDLGGGRYGFNRFVPKVKEGENEPYLIRPARETDLPFIIQLHNLGNRRYLVNGVRDESLWRYELFGKSPQNVNRAIFQVIETPDGEPIGYLAHSPNTWGPSLVATQFEIKPGVSWSQATPSVIRYLHTAGLALKIQEGKQADHDGFGFWLGREHPVYEVLHESLPRVRKPYAWYLRVPDLPDFIRHISPALENRLAESPYQGYTGEIKITFYRSGLWMGIEKGRLVKVGHYSPSPYGHSGDAAFPGLTFLQLLFGYRNMEELTYAFPDCWYETEEVFGLLNALFPKRPCNLWPIS
jgi:hypothetical protein